jgi:hypothetical protein
VDRGNAGEAGIVIDSVGETELCAVSAEESNSAIVGAGVRPHRLVSPPSGGERRVLSLSPPPLQEGVPLRVLLPFG